MKAISFIVFFSFVSVCLTYAQTKFGVKIGGNFSTIEETKSDFDDYEPSLGLQVGGFAKFTHSERFNLQSEITYSRKGAYTKGFNSQESDSKYQLNYVNLPILLGYKFAEKWSFLFGAEFGYLVSAKVKREKKSIDIEDRFSVNKLDFALVAGFEYKLNNQVLVGSRYLYGLSKVREYDTSVATIPITGGGFSGQVSDNPISIWKNRSLQFCVSYTFLK